MSRGLAWMLLPALLGAATVSCQPASDEPSPAEGTGDTAPSVTHVETATLNTTEFREVLELNGETEPIRAANVSAQVGGRIVSLDLEEGEPVEQGDTVMRLAAAQGRATMDRLDVEVAQLNSDIDRTRRLVDRGLATSAELERLESQRAATREAISEVRAGVGETRHRAPISGVVTERYYEEGEWVGQGNEVARIVDISTIVVRVGLPERDISYVHEGLDVSVRIPALGETLTGTIAEIGVEANPRNRTFPLEIHIDNSSGHLRSGMRALVTLVKRDFPEALVIPRDAVLRTVSGSEVFLNEASVAMARPIELGPGSGRFVMVTSGLGPGDQLIVRGHRALVQGEAIEVSRTSECCRDQFYRYHHGQPAEGPATEEAGFDDVGSEPAATAAEAVAPGG